MAGKSGWGVWARLRREGAGEVSLGRLGLDGFLVGKFAQGSGVVWKGWPQVPLGSSPRGLLWCEGRFSFLWLVMLNTKLCPFEAPLNLKLVEVVVDWGRRVIWGIGDGWGRFCGEIPFGRSGWDGFGLGKAALE